MTMTNEQVVNAIGSLYNAVLDCSAPCNHEAVAGVLATLNGAILSGKEVELESAVHAWAVSVYPDVYAAWQRGENT
jgi:hypothetical protein